MKRIIFLQLGRYVISIVWVSIILKDTDRDIMPVLTFSKKISAVLITFLYDINVTVDVLSQFITALVMSITNRIA